MSLFRVLQTCRLEVRAQADQLSILRELFLLFRPLERLLHVLPRFFQRAKCVVVRLQGLAVFVDGTFPLSGDVEDLPQLDPAPHFRPARLAISIDRFAIRICRRLIVSLQEKDFLTSRGLMRVNACAVVAQVVNLRTSPTDLDVNTSVAETSVWRERNWGEKPKLTRRR